jgi:hypothetical protein
MEKEKNYAKDKKLNIKLNYEIKETWTHEKIRIDLENN